MRLALLSDIHGNLAAFEAVLADLAAAGPVDHTWVLGDLAAFGTQPAACIQRVMAMEDAKVIQGNTDRYLVTNVRPKDFKPSEENWDNFAPYIKTRDAAFLWTIEQMGWPEAEYLMKLGTDLALEIDDYGWAVGFHAVPGNDEWVLPPDADEHDIRDALLDREGRLAIGGHTHQVMDRDIGDWRFINPGSIGFPLDGDNRAAYAILEFENGGLTVDQRRVAYDVEAAIAEYDVLNHPFKDIMAHRLRTATP